MATSSSSSPPPCVLITGAGKGIGAAIARELHGAGMDVIIHYRHSGVQAEDLAETLNETRSDSANTLQADLMSPEAAKTVLDEALCWRERIDVLINNAALFFPTPLARCKERDWQAMMQVNLRTPFLLAQQLAAQAPPPGHIINITDIYAHQSLANHPIYCISQAGLAMMTRVLAQELAPDTLVNSVAPGAISWPQEKTAQPGRQKAILKRTALQRPGLPRDVARAVRFLIQEGDYITGQTITVDGGRNL